MKMNKFDFMDMELETRAAKNRLRRLRIADPKEGPVMEIDGKRRIVFCSNDYLGLSQHPLLKERAAAYVARYGAGSTASRLINGNLPYFGSVEKKLAVLKGTEAALILNSGWQANVSLLPALTDRKSLILSDRLNHNSLINGCLLSRCRVTRFRHNDMDHLEQLLEANRGAGFSRIVIVTESVFSMDGDESDIDRLVSLSRTFNAILMVDEAHATGVLGPKGMGLTCGKGVDVVMGTFGKGLGSFGAYIACSGKVRAYMINSCAGFFFSTGLPPGVLGAVDAALEVVPRMDGERAGLHGRANRLRESLQAMGWSTGPSTTQIVPVLVGSERDALALSAFLEDRGILASAIRPPTVPEGESRIRISLSALHTDDHLDQLIDAFRAWGRK
jgi:8-amino-7-oxononanoate synthase